MFALVDCNSFYASCERLFRPDLKNRPVVVLSNNDGCVIARSDEAKAVGVPMGAPFHEIRELARQADVSIFSSNYSLYGDLSARVVSVLRELCPSLERYSIDESFCDVGGIPDPAAWGRVVCERIQGEVGVPVCVGIARTRTLAKAANHVAKKFKARTGGVHVLDSSEREEKALRWLPVEDVWGVGRAWGRKLQADGIRTAWDFSRRPEPWVRKTHGVVLARTWKELRGISCGNLYEDDPVRRSLRTSRSFGHRLTEREPFEEAVSTFASRTAAKLRERGLCATSLSVSSWTDESEGKSPRQGQGRTGRFEVPTNRTLEMVSMALRLARSVWRDGARCKKAGVEAWGLVPENAVQESLFGADDRERSGKLQGSLDRIALRWGHGAVNLAVQGSGRSWAPRREHLSRRYTTRWDELLEIDMDRVHA